MNMKPPRPPQRARPRWLLFWLPALALLLTGFPGCQNEPAPTFGPDINLQCNPQPGVYSFEASIGTALDESFHSFNNTSNSNLFWSFNPPPSNCDGAFPSYNCNGVNITLPSPPPSPPDSAVTVKGTPTAAGFFGFTIRVETADGASGCNRDYTLAIAGPVTPKLEVTPARLAFGKPPTDRQTLTVTNQGAAPVSQVDFAVSCAATPCPFQAPPKISSLAPGASEALTVSFLRAQAPLWMTDYPATLSVTVPNTSYRSEVALIGNKGEPVITRQPEQLDLSSPGHSKGSVTLGNQEDEKLAGVALGITDCAGDTPCPFSASPLSFDLQAKGDAGHGDAKLIDVELARNTCLGTANLEFSVPGLARPAGTVKLKGSGEGLRECTQDSASVRECRNGQWQTQSCAPDSCTGGECRCTQDGTACASPTARSVCKNGVRGAEACPASHVCVDNVCRAAQLTVRKILEHPDPNCFRQFNLQIDGVTVQAGVNGGSTGPHLLSPGNHVVGETAANSCTSLAQFHTVMGGDCDASGNVSLAPGDSKTCTITNYDNFGGCPKRNNCCPPGTLRPQACQCECCESGEGTEACKQCASPCP